MMRRSNPAVERAKTALIVLLTLSAALLGLSTGLFDQFIRSGQLYIALEDMLLPEMDSEDEISPAALPGTVMVGLDGEGEYYGRRTDTGEDGPGVSALYELFSANLGEALGSSGRPENVTLESWEAALSGPGVLFSYDVVLPMELLARWLNTEAGGAEGEAYRLFLALGDGVDLYYLGPDGAPRRCDTAVSPDSLWEKMASLEPNGADYAFRREVCGADRYSVYLTNYDGLPAVNMWSAGPLVYEQLDGILERLEVNAALSVAYSEGEDRIIVEDDITVRVSADGGIAYQCREESGRLTVSGSGLAGAVQTARALADDILLPLSGGDAQLYLTGWTEEAEGYTLTFGYYMGGLPVWPDVPAATVTIRSGAVTEAVFSPRQLLWSWESVAVMHELYASVAAGEDFIVLAYAEAPGALSGQSGEAGYTALSPQWLRVGAWPPGESGVAYG